jgi:hypothetical protein
MVRDLSVWGLIALLVTLSVGCTTGASSQPDGSYPGPGADPVSAEPGDGALSPGQYCYGIDSETLTGAVRLTIQANQGVMGDSSFIIHNQEASYFSAYLQDLEGLLDQNQASLEVTTWIEYDLQNSEEIWTVTPTTLTTETDQLGAIDCAIAQERFAGPDGLDASQLLAGLDDDDLIALEFPLGEPAVTHQGELAAGEKARFEFYSEGGQLLEITVNSPDGTVTFDMIAPSGYILARSQKSVSTVLPHTGWQTLLVNSNGSGPTAYEFTIAQ